MRNFLQFIIKRPLIILFAVAVIVFGGIYSALHMPVDLFPNLEVPVVNIITHLPAVASEDIELLISRPIEDQMRTIPQARRVASTSVQGISQVTVEFTWGTTVRDARQVVQAELARLRNILPSGVNPRLENIGTTLQEVVGYVLYGGSDLVTLRNIIQHDLASRLMDVEGVSLVQVLGGDRRAFNVSIKPETLARLHQTVNDVVATIRKNNISVTAGYLDRSSREYLIRGDGRLKTIDDIRSLPVVSDGENSVLLGSIADVSEGVAPRHYVVRGDGIPAVAFIVSKQPGAGTIDVVRGVEAKMADLRTLLPQGTNVKKFYDQSEIIAEARNAIFHNMLAGAFLAILVLYFFLGSLRPTLIVALTIPISILAALAIMGLSGLSLNIITMTALTLAIGMIVDDAIVVAENIYRNRLNGLNEIQASIQGTAEIAGPDASGTFTTVAAFVPLILVTGLAALFLKPFGLTISTALLASLILSLTLVPVLLSRTVSAVPHTDFAGARLLGLLNRLTQTALRYSFKHKRRILCVTILFLSLAGLAAFLGKVNVLPPIDEGALLIEYVMPPGTALSESNRIGDALDRIALADQDVLCVYRRTGSPETGYQIEGVNKGELVIKLKPKTGRKRSVTEIMAALKKAYTKFNGVVFLYHQPTQEKIDESFSGLPALFGVTIYGTDMDTLVSLGNKVEGILAKDPAIANIVNNTKVKSPEINVRLDYPKLAQYGVKAEDVFAALQASQFGLEATRIIRQKEDVAVMVKMPISKPPDLVQFRQLPVTAGNGEIIPLDRVADIQISHVPASITRLNGQREITLMAEVNGSITSAVSRLRKQFSSIELPKGYSIDFTGQYKTLIETATEMLFVFLAAVVLIYLIMVMQFHSWLQPLIILFTVPLSLVGGIIALFITRQGIDVSVGMGVVTLVGISVNNAIVLFDCSNRNISSGNTVQESLLFAASVRLRPVLMTALTTIFALVPTAIGTTVGSNIFQPFAVTVIGGLISGTIGTLLIVPTIVAAVSHHRESGQQNK
ncbi:MAG: efflux RND transporter permease subunit [Phycisphaerae bacterium]|nr:efflux RND transporter permease subunit [Phycisphaerae bacterium]